MILKLKRRIHMNIDFHTHANLSKKINVSIEDLEEKMQEARASGLTALAITEHFNATNIIELYEKLQEKYPYQNDYYQIAGRKSFVDWKLMYRKLDIFLSSDLGMIFWLLHIFFCLIMMRRVLFP